MSIRAKLQSILILLFVFIVGLVGLNFFTFNELKGDSPAVNASGSLRMRAYQLAWGAARRRECRCAFLWDHRTPARDASSLYQPRHGQSGGDHARQ